MAMENPDNLNLDASVVVRVHTTMIPNMMGILEGIRAGDLDRFTSDLLRLEESVVRVAHQLKSYCLRLIREVRLHVARCTFDMLWHRLAYEFQQYCEQCFQLGINVSDPRCLVLTEDEAAENEDARLFQL